MADASVWPSIVGTVCGAAVGGAAAFATAQTGWRQQRVMRQTDVKRDAYAQYLGVANKCFSALLDLLWGLQHEPHNLDSRTARAHERQEELVVAKAAMDILASPLVEDAAGSLQRKLQALDWELYKARLDDDTTQLKQGGQYREDFRPLQEMFIKAVKAELSS